METIETASWEDFEERLETLIEQKKQKQVESVHHISEFLFRGQANSEWGLETTLERYCCDPFSVKEYYRSISIVKSEIETFSGLKWDMPIPPDYNQWLEQNDFLTEFPAYEYMVYLRHNGFPSPLLDWSRSPFIAAFFAFSDLMSKSDMVSIFVYQEYAEAGKTWSSSAPHIFTRGPLVTSHKRHFLQKAEYTVCVMNTPDPMYTYHGKAFKNSIPGQDILYKFNIPSSERVKVLKKFDNYNINSFALFGSEDSLVSTMALREFFLKK